VAVSVIVVAVVGGAVVVVGGVVAVGGVVVVVVAEVFVVGGVAGVGSGPCSSWMMPKMISPISTAMSTAHPTNAMGLRQPGTGSGSSPPSCPL
jgi:hypothetical protein